MDVDACWTIDFAIEQILPVNINQTRKKLRERINYAVAHGKLKLTTDNLVYPADFLAWAQRRGLNVPQELRNAGRADIVIPLLGLEAGGIVNEIIGGFDDLQNLEEAFALLRQKDMLIIQLQNELQQNHRERDALQLENTALRQVKRQHDKAVEDHRKGAAYANQKKQDRYKAVSNQVDALRKDGYTEQEAVNKVVKEIELTDRSACYGDRGRSIRRIRKNTTR